MPKKNEWEEQALLVASVGGGILLYTGVSGFIQLYIPEFPYWGYLILGLAVLWLIRYIKGGD